jgi:23S rRNA (cytidine1920-2'-O)/16S rRNA (cytidine1409-2'-O)-methyltransferase
MARRRLDAELVRRGLADSRERARTLIESGAVTVNGAAATKPARQVDPADALVVAQHALDAPASRGAGKLLSAAEVFLRSGLRPLAGRLCLDAGASTGGFTDVLLREGAAGVIAVDVGYGQLIWRLREDPRVVVMDRTNIRYLAPTDLPWRPDLIVADLSFISLRTVLPALVGLVVDPPAQGQTDPADMLLMVKPQFEVGRERLGSHGVVRDPDLRAQAVGAVCAAAAGLGWGTAGVTASLVPGPSGNVEYFVWLRRDAAPVNHDEIDRAVAEGPMR